MKTYKIKQLLIIFISLINGCYLISPGPEIQLKNGFNGDGIAVLNFSVHGDYIPANIGQIAADKFTDALFITNKFNVIDRARANEAQKTLEINSSEVLSEDDIQKIGLKLKSKFLVLGRVQQVSKSEFYNSSKELYISFRIISISDADVVGIGKYSSNYQNDLVAEVESMVYAMVNKIETE